MSLKSIHLIPAIILLLWGNCASRGQEAPEAPVEVDELAESVGLTGTLGTLPIWSKPSESAQRTLSEAVRTSRQGVMLVGGPRSGIGTAFVISRKHRLLATNAHVADLMARTDGKMQAVLNETATTYDVEQVWYHPGVIRRKPVGDKKIQLVHSINPKDGGIYTRSPDVAVLKLAAGGPDLPFEFKFATADEMKDPFARGIAMVGYPGRDQGTGSNIGLGKQIWPARGERAQATFEDGRVSKVTNFEYGSDKPRQFLQHNAQSWGGFSGSPLILTSGRVIGIHNSSRGAKGRGGRFQRVAQGIRIDCLWELLAHHDLDEKVPIPVDRSALDLDRLRRIDERKNELIKQTQLAAKYRQTLDDVERHIRRGEFTTAVFRCSAIILASPNYPEAYRYRAWSYSQNAEDNRDKISDEARRKLLENALQNTAKFLSLSPNVLPEYRPHLANLLALASVEEKSSPRDARAKAQAVLDAIERLRTVAKQIVTTTPAAPHNWMTPTEYSRYEGASGLMEYGWPDLRRRALVILGRYDEALALGRDEDPDHHAPYFFYDGVAEQAELRGEIYKRLGQKSKARGQFRAAESKFRYHASMSLYIVRTLENGELPRRMYSPSWYEEAVKHSFGWRDLKFHRHHHDVMTRRMEAAKKKAQRLE